VNELNGGSVIGSDGQPVDTSENTDLIRSDGGVWNEHTLSWEIIKIGRAQETYELVQRRRRRVQFAREYESYASDVSAEHHAGRLPLGVHGPEVHSDGDVRGGSGDGPC